MGPFRCYIGLFESCSSKTTANIDFPYPMGKQQLLPFVSFPKYPLVFGDRSGLCLQMAVDTFWNHALIPSFADIVNAFLTEVGFNMMTSSKGNIFRFTGPLCREFTGHRWIPLPKGQWLRALMFSLICVLKNSWVNNHEAGDLRRHRAHYDVIVMNPLNPSDTYMPSLVQMMAWHQPGKSILTYCHLDS